VLEFATRGRFPGTDKCHAEGEMRSAEETGQMRTKEEKEQSQENRKEEKTNEDNKVKEEMRA
jgi:hypothetical protein